MILKDNSKLYLFFSQYVTNVYEYEYWCTNHYCWNNISIVRVPKKKFFLKKWQLQNINKKNENILVTDKYKTI